MALYPARALERAMKINEIITRAISGKINWMQAAEILGMYRPTEPLSFWVNVSEWCVPECGGCALALAA